MDERRNLYRLLHLQPDAPLELVRENYRTLMTKLARHPDLGGDHWNAASLGAAYTTLKDPKKRAAYDRDLLKKYHLHDLSRGSAAARPERAAQPPGLDPIGNQRNYYRVLGLQHDAPTPVVEAAYRALRSSSTSAQEIGLLDAAFDVLADSARRTRYDEALARSGHAPAGTQATKEIRSAEKQKSQAHQAARRPDTSEPEPAPDEAATPSAPTSELAVHSPAGYEPLISDYCKFCMTPHAYAEQPGELPREFDSAVRCRECDSPLFSPPTALMALGRREVARLGRDEAAILHVDWPGPRVSARALEISPTGLRCRTDWPIEKGERVRVDLSVLCAVGEVTHHRRWNAGAGEVTEAGLRFLTVAFERPKGGFFSTLG